MATSSAEAVVPTPESLVERVELQRLIAGEVVQLAEPYRSTVLLHFFEELSCAEIARRCALPEGTVRRRLKVALDELRARLDARDPKAGRIALLAPIAGISHAPQPAPLALGVLAMKKVVAAVVVLIVLLVGAFLWRSHKREQPDSARAVSSSNHPTSAVLSKNNRSGAPVPTWFTTPNATARKIAGRVTLNGAPIKDAVVSLQSELTRAGYTAPIELRTDASGAFDFGVHAPARYDIAASSPGTTAALLSIDLANPALKPAADRLELRLRDCSVSIAGTIYDASNNPLPEAHVKRMGDRNDASRGGIVGVKSDSRGAYRICVPFGDAELEYSADGFGSVILTIDARGELYRDVVLVPEASVTVRVVRADNDQPVADAHVFVNPAEWGVDRAAQRTGVTDRDGRVRIEGLVPGRFQAWGFAAGLQARGSVEVLAEIGASAEVLVKLETMARITGKVVDADKPVVGALIIANRKSPIARTQPVFSLLDGSFVIDRVPAGEITLSATPYDVTSPAQLTVEAGKTYDVVLDVHALGAIRGRVTRLGKPAADVDVCCVGNPLDRPSVRTDTDGRYEFLGVPAGKYPISAGSDLLGAFTLGTTITLNAGEQRILDLELDQAGAIAGTVVDREGMPVKGVFVRWVNEKSGDVGRSITDTQGHYRCGAMTGGGKYRASVHPSTELPPYPTAEGGPYPALDLKDGKTLLEGVVLAIDRQQLSISGHVVDDSGSPVADAFVKALPTSGGQTQFHSWLRLPMSSTDTDGAFTISGLASGSYAVQARGANGAEGIASPVNAGASGVEVRVDRPGAIEGRLVGFTQPPEVYVRPLTEVRYVAATINGANYRVSSLRPGRYVVNAQTTQEGEARVVEVRGGQVARADLTSQGRATIEGRVLDFRTRAPIANSLCHAVMNVRGSQGMTNMGPMTGVKSDADGRVMLDPAPAGSVTVACRVPAARYSQPSADLTVAAGARASVELLAVELTIENPTTIGATTDWRVTQPRITAIVPKGPAANAGMQVGDLITHVNGVSVQGLNGAGVMWLIDGVPAGNEVRITVVRGGTTKTLAMRTVAEL